MIEVLRNFKKVIFCDLVRPIEANGKDGIVYMIEVLRSVRSEGTSQIRTTCCFVDPQALKFRLSSGFAKLKAVIN